MAIQIFFLAVFLGLLTSRSAAIQDVTSTELGTAVGLSAQLMKDLVNTANVDTVDPVTYATMFQQNPTDIAAWAPLALSDDAITNAQDAIDMFLAVTDAAVKRDIKSPIELLRARQENPSLIELANGLNMNVSASFTEAKNKEATVCAGKSQKCALCFVSSSMIYLGANTACAIAAVGGATATAFTLTPAMAAVFATCMSVTTGTLIAKLATCGDA